MWVWGGCCCDFDFVGVLYGIYEHRNNNNESISYKCTLIQCHT